MYRLIKSILFRFDPEKIHHFTVSTILAFSRIPGFISILEKCFVLKDKRLERNVFGIKFPNPVGLAAGFDKNAQFFHRFFSFGFGFIEVGTLTPRPQAGNDKPRMFRLKQDHAIINRMGFNNEGADKAASRLKRLRKPGMVIGGNIGKNKDTPNEFAVKDYERSFEELYPLVDYFAINVSSPNTLGLRALQDKEPLRALLFHIQELNFKKPNPKPILLKIAPDLNNSQLDDIVEIVLLSKIAGVIATNTSLSREQLQAAASLQKEAGGLSGKPLNKRSTEVIAYLHHKSKGAFPIIGVGGIHSPQDALDKLNAGASLVQIYTGFIYQGPALIKRINRAILKKETKLQ